MKMIFGRTLLLLVVVFACHAKVKHRGGGKKVLKHLKGIGGHHGTRSLTGNEGLWPSVFNVATKALVTANATCGERGREEYCKMAEGGRGRCGICDNYSLDSSKRHPVDYATDGTNRWWQSPALYYGPEFEYVTIEVDLKQVYQVTYVIIKSANSPRPGAWILERSVDGNTYEPWQYFATNDKECTERYNVPTTKGKPRFSTDTEVKCTSTYSRLTPLENGEIHISLIQGRPGANETSPELLEFTKARFVRIRLQGLRGNVEPIPKWLAQDENRDKRLFYSVKDITIGGQCVCNGHAANCRHNVASGHPECECTHNTCGSNCERCCPLFNQRQWGPGTSRDSRKCIPCNCNRHASSCRYDEAVDRAGLSLDILGNLQGGGVCENCTAFTTGINCERCLPGYYRPFGMPPDADFPCTKCECDPQGSTGFCEPEGAHAGVCQCRPGYAGRRCDSCAEGYRGFPNCEVCPCDARGVLVRDDCEGECVCKENVEGKFCDQCKAGHFALKAENYVGCSPCYCSGTTTLCESALVSPTTIETLAGWLISDLKVTNIEKPTVFEQDMLFIGNYEQSIETYYWLAPKDYLGNRLESYDGLLTFKVHWVIMRGDTSGVPTKGPNVILVGANGMQIAHGDDVFIGTNMTFRINMREQDWYHVPVQIKDIVARPRRTEYKGDPTVTRQQFLSVLSNLKYMLLRASFHTDQVECLLEQVTLQIGHQGQTYGTVEQCSCPSGYEGLSCESCSYGHVRMTVNTSTYEEQGYCLKCDCNGHSQSCDPDTGQCLCEHNTVGEKCERCLPGFYGNPLKGSPSDCNKCACPLLEETNNFSPSCQLDYSEDDEGIGYVCTQCPKGYTGDHCEICDNGYYGNPAEVGGKCDQCDCNGGPCDSRTGQCLSCKGNTEGFKCEKCKPHHYGDPTTASCQPCLCDPQGSAAQECDNATGQCRCKDKFTGRTCDKCEEGHGNVTALCAPCQCNPVGSRTHVCDQHTGICECQPGVEGFRCDACQHLHYGFSEAGCQSCKCNTRGSEITTCDIITGQCRCRPNYTGLKCDNCQPGFWDHHTEGCVKCSCDETGSFGDICDNSGQCSCKPGVGGVRCDTCLDKYYGFGDSGCKPCQHCNKLGHICDQRTGACVCPPLKEGAECQNCIKDTWLSNNTSCIACGCSETGSVRSQCSAKTGQCSCKQGYEGDKCERCSHGYYGFPKCRRCSCNPIGTDPYKGRCDKDSVCQCDEQGYCPCKPNVTGKRCNTCKENTFGLDLENPEGCTKCFCFERSDKCVDAGLTWDQERSNDRILTLVYNQPEIRPTFISNDINAVREIPSTYTDVSIEPSNEPPYWRLPINFSGDLTLSYGGYLRFVTQTHGGSAYVSQDFIGYPVQIHGKATVLEPYNFNRGEIKIHEFYWTERNRRISREQLMVVLQNVTKILIKATDSVHFANATLSNVSLDKAREMRGKPPPRALSVEKCECPKEYAGSSCQNPNTGYFRYFPNSHAEAVNFTWIDKVIGKARPCECNEFTNVCDMETGHCLNCSQNRAGFHCERCSEGYYLDSLDTCQPCQCPSKEQNFASSCVVNYDSSFRCFCKPGYSGADCNVCDRGYFGNLQTFNGSCQPCDCNPDGSTSGVCNLRTGKCTCKPGFTGTQCSQCEAPRHVIDNHRCTPCDNCTQLLLDDLETLAYELHSETGHVENGVQPPWERLRDFENKYVYLNDDLQAYGSNKRRAKQVLEGAKLDFYDRKLPYLQDVVKDRRKTLDSIVEDGQKLLRDSEALSKHIESIKKQLQSTINTLKNFGTSHESTKSALAKAKKWYREMNEIARKFKSEKEYRKILSDCDSIARYAADLNNMLLNSNETQNHLDDFRRRLQDLEVISVQTELINQQAEKMNALNRARIANLSRVLEAFDLEGKVSGIGQDVKDIEGIRNKINEFVNQTQSNYEILRENPDFIKTIEELEEREKHLRESLPEIDRYLGLVKVHVEKLERNVTEYKKILNFADEEWKKTIDTYRKLESDTNAAKEAALSAKAELEQAYGIIKPIGKDSINDKASLAYAASTRTLARIQNHQEITDIRNVPINIATAGLDLQLNGKMNNEQTSKLRQIAKNNKIVDLYAIIQQAIDISGQMQKVYQNIQNINYTMYYDLAKDYQKYLNLTTKDQMEELKQKINLARDHLQQVFTEKDTTLEKIKRFNSKIGTNHTRILSIEMKLEELRAKIQRAKEAADGIKVSLTGPSCSRTYMINNLEPSIFSTILVDIKNVTDHERDYSLFYIENESKNQYMDLRINKGKVVFKWQLSKEPHSISLDGGNFGKILVERVAHRVTLTMGDKSKVYHEATEESPILYVTRKNPVALGKASGVPGCIKDVIFNGHRIGFWNFKETQGECSGCIRLHSPDTLLTYFNGNGYSNVSRDNHNQLDPRHISVSFDINTFDENALLLLAPQQKKMKSESKCTTFLAVYLNEGRIQAEIHYSDRPALKLRTPEKFNTGTEQHIEILKSFEDGTDTLILNKNLVTQQDVPRQSVLRIKQVDFYFGGIPPEYRLDAEVRDCWPSVSEGLLGTLKRISGKGGVAIQLTDGDYFGLEVTDGELKHKRAWFSGDGYVILEPTPVENISFVIRTNQTNAFVLSIGEFTVFTIEDGKLNIKFLGDNESVLSDVPINDDEYYYVELTKGRSLKINGQTQGNSVPSGKIENAKIHIGFNPAIPLANFTGGISDIIINNKPLYFKNATIQSFARVKIGNPWQKPVNRLTSDDVSESNTLKYPLAFGIKDMQSTEGCFKLTSYTLDRNAAKFGDSITDPSFVTHFLKNGFWKSDYKLEFEFRTFYPDGLMFIARNIKKAHYILLQLKDGKVQFQSKNKKRKLENAVDTRVNDGFWHKVNIKHANRTKNVIVSVDGEVKVMKILKIGVNGELYIGGIPNDVPDLMKTAANLGVQPFRGCIRALKINDQFQSLVDKNTRHSKIGQCFSNTERGSYFGGDAFAVFKNDFEIQQILEINLEFRTTEMNGILLSVSNSENSPALSIELQNGAVVMTVDSGNGYVSNVTNSLTEYALCNNAWHNVSALYSSWELTVNVDGVRKSWVLQDDMSSMEEIKAPLYIGGLPDDAAIGTLKTRENFKGCIRNIKIGNELMDWTDMDDLNNVLLNSCPVVA